MVIVSNSQIRKGGLRDGRRFGAGDRGSGGRVSLRSSTEGQVAARSRTEPLNGECSETRGC